MRGDPKTYVLRPRLWLLVAFVNGRNRKTVEVSAERTDDLNSWEAKFSSLTGLTGFRASAENVIPLDLSVTNFKLLYLFPRQGKQDAKRHYGDGNPFTKQCHQVLQKQCVILCGHFIVKVDRKCYFVVKVNNETMLI